MKRLMVLIAGVLVLLNLSGAGSSQLQIAGARSQVSDSGSEVSGFTSQDSPQDSSQNSTHNSSEDSQRKIKSKGGTVRITDKSKPVRRALEAQYAKIADANRRKDLGAVLALRTPDFSAQFPNGEIRNSEQMAAYSRALFEQMQPPIYVSNTIETLTVTGDKAVAVVHQRFSRMQLKAGKLRWVETEARQRETWLLTPEGWKLHFVDDVHPGAWYVDGKRVDPSKPYDPESPPYKPEEQ